MVRPEASPGEVVWRVFSGGIGLGRGARGAHDLHWPESWDDPVQSLEVSQHSLRCSHWQSVLKAQPRK